MWILRTTEGVPEKSFRILPGGVRTIGRATGADFIVDAALVSRLHCRLTNDRTNALVVEDLDSTNGILVNGKRVNRSQLRAGDTLTVGRVEFMITAAKEA